MENEINKYQRDETTAGDDPVVNKTKQTDGKE